MNLYIPENLDIDTLIYNRGLILKPLKRDKLLYFIHLLNTMSLTKTDYLSTDYIPLHSQILQSYIHNYAEYLDFLINKLKIVETDNQFIPEFKSKGYRLIAKYRTKVKTVIANDWTLLKKNKNYKIKKSNSVNHLKYLTKWFNEKLQINENLVKAYLKKELELKKHNYDLWDYDYNTKKFKFPINQYNHAMISWDKLMSQDFSLSLDDNVYRLHTILTNMRSMSRNALTYDGQKLFSIDIKNSQPYLSVILLTRLFWELSKSSDSLSISFNKASRIKKEPQEALTPLNNKNKVSHTNTNTININSINNKRRAFYIKLEENPVSHDNKGFVKFISLVIEGKLYEYLQKMFAERLGLKYAKRKDVKAAVFQVLFTDNRYIGQESAKPKKLFKELFPDVYDVFSKIKKGNKKYLPLLLQSIESYLIIDVIAKRISKEYPNAPIYTIHDSISTTKQYVEPVKQIMYEELTKAIGYPPTFEVEEWNEQKIYDYIDTLEQRASETDYHIIKEKDIKKAQ